MTDHRVRSSKDVEVEAVATVGGILTDLVEVAERLPVRADQVEPVARILDRLGQEISEAAAMIRATNAAPEDQAAMLGGVFPPWRTRLDGSVPAGGDERVISARVLIAEKRQPLLMPPGDLRSLLARYQQSVIDLVELISSGSPPPAT
jgi:hypothetical protein